jgi:hypothetical protein
LQIITNGKERVVDRAYHILGKKVEQMGHLTGRKGEAFAFTGDVEEDLPNITAVYPMRGEAARGGLDGGPAAGGTGRAW